ncbi:hypothetical protein FRB95_011662 [Tulasnella sp. JGI-2019a]|nr:hypothetical protein FRB95_011662 [Tulasnella sp. JGI-2019a]
MSSSTATTAAATATASAAAATTSASAGLTGNSSLKVVGVILAITSGLLIGSSFVLKKKGLIASQKGHAAGEGVAYLKSPLWWMGMTMMILGELCNFAAYAFVDAIVVTPMGALSVVICAILSSIFLKETLTFFGWMGCFLCIVGSIIIALNGPQEQAVSTISQFQDLFLSAGFLVFASVIIIGSLVIIFYFAPKYGKKNMIWYIAVCSMIGGLSVSCIQGLGSAIITTAKGDSQFKQWFTYFLILFVTVTLLTEIYYLNVALALFNTAMVTPTYYVIFTACTLITSVVLYQGLKATVTAILTVVLGTKTIQTRHQNKLIFVSATGFFVICAGIIILQMSKVDPESLGKLDRRSTILLKAAQSNTENTEKGISGLEDPGMDALRGSFGAVGSIIRARSARRLSQASKHGSQIRGRNMGHDDHRDDNRLEPQTNRLSTQGLEHLSRHQLYDAPMRASSDTTDSQDTLNPGSPTQRRTGLIPASPTVAKNPTIKFGTEDVAHYYPSPGKAGTAVHEQRLGHHGDTVTLPPPINATRSAPPTQGGFGGYNDPFSSTDNWRTQSQPRSAGPGNGPPSKSDTLGSSFGNDSLLDSTVSLQTMATLDSNTNAYDSSPPSNRNRPSHGHRYPSRGDDDPLEHQRLVGRSGGSIDSLESVDELKAGGIRLLPKIPK